MIDKELFEFTYRRMYPIACMSDPKKFSLDPDEPGKYRDTLVRVAYSLWKEGRRLAEFRGETITHVAIRYEGKTYALPAPNRHPDVVRLIAQENGVGIEGPDKQGFLTNRSWFVDRKESVSIALASGQLKSLGNIRGDSLYSEDLW